MRFFNFHSSQWRIPLLAVLLLGLLPLLAAGDETRATSPTRVVFNTGCPNDFDCDEIPDDQDLDDDNDGILDTEECSPNVAEAVFSVAGGVTRTFNMPNASEGFTFDLYYLDNSFNFEINGTNLVPQQIEFAPQANSVGDSFVAFESDGAVYGGNGIPQIYSLNNNGQNDWDGNEIALVRIIIDGDGNVSFFGRRNVNSLLEPLTFQAGDPGFNNITWNSTGGNTVIIQQDVVGNTDLSGLGYGIGSDCNAVNTDGLGGNDDMDLDSDEDGCSDVSEAGYDDPDGDGFLGSGLHTFANGGVDANGLVLNAGGYFGTTNAVSNDLVCCDIGITSLTVTDAGCNGGQSGTVTVVGSGTGTIDYALNLNGVQVAANQTGVFTGLAANTYSVLVYNAADVTCLNEQIIVISDDSEAPTFDNCPITAYTANLDGGTVTVSLADLGVTASDNCTAATVAIDQANSTVTYGCDDLGANAGTILVTATDGTNAATPCSVSIDVTDSGSSCGCAAGTDFDDDGVCDDVDEDDDNDGILDVDECIGSSEINFEFNGTFGTIVGNPNQGNDPNNYRDLENPVTVLPGESAYTLGNTAAAEGRYYVISGYGVPILHGSPNLWPDDFRGHTTGTIEDAFLAVNGSTSQGTFFRETVTLSQNTDYEFGAWASNANKFGGGDPVIGIRILNSMGTVIGTVTSGNDLEINDNVWVEVKGSFNTGSETSFTIEVYNVSTSGGGNDFSIDDVFFRSDVPSNCNNATNYDSDGDGCNDVLEAGFTDGDDDGQLGTGTPAVDPTNGRVVGHNYVAPNSNVLDPNISVACCNVAITSATPTPENCPGANDGMIDVVATGATTINYTLTQGGNTVATNQTGDFSGLAPGSYTVTASDNMNGSCTVTSSTVTVNAGTDTEAPTFSDNSEITLYSNNFEAPINPIIAFDCGFGIDLAPPAGSGFQGINYWYGTVENPYLQTNTVEPLEINNFAAGYIDAAGTGGEYCIGMLSTSEDDLLGLTFNTQGKTFLNVRMDISPIGLNGCFNDNPTAPIMQLRVYDSPGGSFDYGSPGALLATENFTGLDADPVDPKHVFNWTEVIAGLDVTGNTDGNVTLVWDLLAGGYAAFDNLVINASNISVSGDCPPDLTIQCLSDLPTATSLEGFDNCDPNPTVTFNESTVDNNVNDQVVIHTWTVTDAASLSTQCVQTITVSDTEAPTFDCASSLTVTLDLCGEYTLSASEVVTNATDLCGGAVTITPETIALSGAGTADQTFTISDGTNSAPCVVSVTTQENANTFTITAGNDDLGTECPDQEIIIDPADLLLNDNISNGNTLEVQEVTLVDGSLGSIVPNQDGTFSYFPTAGTTGTVAFNYLVKTDGDDLFFDLNNHFYEFITSADISWTAAKADAETKTRFGLQGYLATITSAEENAFIVERLEGNGWIGASDDMTEGVWTWRTGPEAGQQFWQGGANGSVQNGLYANWDRNNNIFEPNDLGGEDYAHLIGAGQQTNTGGDEGFWNDWTDDIGAGVPGASQGYVIEYGGLESCTPSLTATAMITLNLEDSQAPETPSLSALTGECSVTVTAPTTTDDCAGTITGITTTDISAPLTASTTITWTFSDGTNEVMVDQDVVINDVTSATAACNATVELTLDTETVTLTAADLDNNSSDNCGGSVNLAITDGQTVFGCDDIGEAAVTVTLSADDGTNAATTCTSQVTVVAGTFSCNGAPTITCAPVTVNADSNCEGAAAGADFVATSNDPDGDMLTFTAVPAGPYALGETTVTVTADDGKGGTATCSTTITVEDNTAPTFTCPATYEVTLDLCGEYTLTTDELNLNASDNCGGAVTATLSETDLSGAGNTSVTVTVSDGTNSDNSCVVDVTALENPDAISITLDDDVLDPSCPGAQVIITAADLLSNDNVSGGNVLEVQDVFVANPAHGSVVNDGNGIFTFTPAPGVTGAVAFTYLAKVQGDDLFFSGNGHLYEFIDAPDISWTAARNAAAALTRFGQSGYLVTITSQAEQNFVRNRLNGFGWMGASDAGTPDQWFWVTGPEAGTQFWTGRANGSRVNGQYENWHPQEPNNATVSDWSPQGESYAHLRADGRWNDYPHTVIRRSFIPGVTERIDGYVVEFGGIGCQPVTTATGNISLTIEDDVPPTAVCVDPFTVDIDAVTESISVTPEMLDENSSDNCNFTLTIDNGNPTYTCGDVGQTFSLQLNITDVGSNTDNCMVNVTVGDANSVCYTCDLGFTVAAPATMTEPAVPPGIITSRIVCGNDGAITVNAFCNGCDDGDADLVYSINGTDFQAGNTFTGLDEGDYTVTIRDQDMEDCFATTSATIGECVGEIPNNGQDDDCDTETDEPGTVSWILLEAGGDAPCVSTTDDCDGTFCYGLEYTPAVSGVLTSYTTGFTMDCFAGSTPLISNTSCVMVDNSFDAADCAGGNGAFFNSSGNDGTVMIKKDESIILHQICLTIPVSSTTDIVEDMITDITMSIDVAPVLSTDAVIVATDRPEYTTVTAAGNFPPVASITGTIDDCYMNVAAAEAAAVAATSATDDYTDVADLTFTPSTVGDCSAIITVVVSDLCGLTDEVTFNTRIDGDAPVVTGALAVVTEEGCSSADATAAVDNIAALELLGEAGFDIADNCTPDADLEVTSADVVADEGTCTITITRTYTITDECDRVSTVEQTIIIMDTTAPEVTGSLTATTVEGCTASDAPAALTTVAALEDDLLGDLEINDICTDDADLVVNLVSEVIGTDCPIVITRTYSVTDACDNTSDEFVHEITITDTQNPDVTVNGTLDDCYAVEADALAAAIAATAASDNCDTDVELTAVASGSCPSTITVTGKDNCGNMAMVTYTTQITDGAVPTEVGGPAATSADIQTELDVVTPAAPVFEDVCGNQLTGVGPTIADNYNEGDCQGTIAYTYTYTDCAGTETTWTFTYNIDCQGLKLKVFTEGNYLGGGMLSTTLNDNHLLPGQDKGNSLNPTVQFFASNAAFGHPYSGAPWSYNATTGAGYGDASRGDAPVGVQAYPHHVTDWVLVTVRIAGDQPGNNFWQCAGWLHENGEVTFPEICPINLDATETYYVVIEHRNHLPIMMEASVSGSGANIYLDRDFTTQNSFAPVFRFGQVEMEAGVFGMFTGNANQTISRTSINSADRTDWRIDQNKIGYYPGDFNLNVITNSDDETLWKFNQNKTSGIRF